MRLGIVLRWFSITPARLHGEVRQAWHAIETVRHLYEIDSPKLAAGYTVRLAADLQDQSCPLEVNQLGRTIGRWATQISNWHQSKVTNGTTEGSNKRVAFRRRFLRFGRTGRPL